MNHAEIELHDHLTNIIGQWSAQLITNRELVLMITQLGKQLPPIKIGSLDPNTGLRYTAESMKAR